MNCCCLRAVAVIILLSLLEWKAQGAELEPKALLLQAADFLQQQPAFSVRADHRSKINAPNLIHENQVTHEIVVVQPNKLAMIVEQIDDGISIYCNGQELIVFVPSVNKYVVHSAPETFGGFLQTEVGDIVAGPSASGFLLRLLDPEFKHNLPQDVSAATYVGREAIDGKAYHRCRFEQEQFDWEIWIAAEGEPTIARIKPDMSKRLQAAGGQFRDEVKIEMTLSFTDWNFDPKFDDATFTFTPPEGAEKLDSFFQQQEEQGPHPLLGKVAPPFTLENLDGKPVDLARHLGKEIVILDFWATWCGPCIAAMPEVRATADKFAKRGVALYFVNLQEDAETIRAFLEEQKLDVPVALDIEGAVAAEYGVTGIPQTVIIGKDGKVQVVHVGFSDKLQQQLTAEIEDLLAGKDLAAAELAKYEEQAEDDVPADTP